LDIRRETLTWRAESEQDKDGDIPVLIKISSCIRFGFFQVSHTVFPPARLVSNTLVELNDLGSGKKNREDAEPVFSRIKTPQFRNRPYNVMDHVLSKLYVSPCTRNPVGWRRLASLLKKPARIF
jgi:hypothetical protein